MKQGTASETAYLAGLSRALHQLDHPRVFTDPMARHFVRQEDAAKLQRSAKTSSFMSKLRAALAVRSRMTEEALHDAVQRGVRQYVVLGAGFDTFALRSPFEAQGVEVFEVDHPDTQRAKRQMMEAAGLTPPAALRWAPADFSTQGLVEVLDNAGFDFARPAFFSFLGVSMYLPEPALMRTLQAIALHCAHGSEVMFDYLVDAKSLGLLERIGVMLLRRRVARMGEPMVTFLDPHELPQQMIRLGFRGCENVGTDALVAKVRAEHNLPASHKPPRFGVGRLARATV